MSVVRIANCSGYSGDRLEAIREVLDGGPVDVLTGDYLAELTMANAAGRRMRGREPGFGTYLLRQLESCWDDIRARGIKVVVNAGGFDAAALAAKVREAAGGLRVAHLEGDDVLGRLDALQAEGHALTHLDDGRPLSEWGLSPNSASAYVGGWGIADALTAGADVVICGRVTDASLVVGAAAWWHEWKLDDWDRLAHAVVVGHVIECGAQATGGNFSGFERIDDLLNPGFPLAEVAEDGSTVITKHPGTGGAVDRDTVTAQLLYEIQGTTYRNPDVTVDFGSIELTDEGPDRTRIHGVRGGPPPATTKVAITAANGYENAFNVYLCGLDIGAKAALVERQVRERLEGTPITLKRVELIGSVPEDPRSIEAATVTMRFVGRAPEADDLHPARFYLRCHSVQLGSAPGFHADGGHGRSTRALPVLEYWPGLLPQDAVPIEVVHDDGSRTPVRVPPCAEVVDEPGHAPPEEPLDLGDTVRVPLGRVAFARAGDKGGNANVGLWVTDEAAWPWLQRALTVEEIRRMLPEAGELQITRHELPHLRAVHFVLHGLLGSGATSNARHDSLGKSVGEFLRARQVDVPRALL